MLTLGIALGWMLCFPCFPIAAFAVDNSAQATSPNTNTPPTGDTSSDNTGLQAEESDPLEPFNSAMFTFNLKVDDYVLHPAASGYAKVIPQGGREAVGARSTT
jgi:ABC-type transporter lipoprotein component MlaA